MLDALAAFDAVEDSYEAGKATDHEGATLDEVGNVLSPPPPRKQATTPHQAGDHRRREVRTGPAPRQTRAGEVVPQDATRLAYMLNLLASMIETHDLERRIAALEGHRRAKL